MWGRFYWRKKRGKKTEGILVLYAWIWSHERFLKPYVDLYLSLGWDCLICHVDILTQFFPEKGMELACGILDELIKEIKIRSLPIVFAAFSDGSKGFYFKVLQLIGGKCEGRHAQDDYQLLRESVSGQIFDSCPSNFNNDLSHQTPRPQRMFSWMAKAFGSGFDTLFLNGFEARRFEYQQALHFSSGMGPFLVFYSEANELALFQTVVSFSLQLQALGADVNVIKWGSSSHLAHQAKYKAIVNEFLAKSSLVFSRKQLTKSLNNKIPESVCNLHNAAFSSNESLRRIAVEPGDHFFLPSSAEFSESRPEGAMIDERKGDLFQLSSIEPQGILGQVLFDVCIPKNIEGWDIKTMPSLKKTNDCRHHRAFNPIKCITRSKL